MHYKYQPNWKVTALMASSVIFTGIAQAGFDQDNHLQHYFCNAASIASLLAIPIVADIKLKDSGWYIAGYLSLRYALKDPVYNLATGHTIDYLGERSTFSFSGENNRSTAILLSRGVFLYVGISLKSKY